MDRWILCVGAGTGALLMIAAIIRSKRRRQRTWPKDTVVLHQLARGPWTPSLSPFPIKLETYLRMAGIPYQNDFDEPMSYKGKTPWITYNGEDVADSELSIKYLNKKLDINLNKHLTTEQEATAVAFQRMVDEHLFWSLTLWRWKYEPGLAFIEKALRYDIGFISPLIRILISRKATVGAWGQGMGRHGEAEVYDIANTDLKALSDYLGNKPYLTGPEPCQQDCSVFGMMSQIVWQLPDSPLEKMVNDKYPNLREYCVRMKERFWPHWDQCITHGCTVKACK